MDNWNRRCWREGSKWGTNDMVCLTIKRLNRDENSEMWTTKVMDHTRQESIIILKKLGNKSRIYSYLKGESEFYYLTY